MTIIVFDCESTGLLAPQAAGVEHQPYLIDLYAIKLNSEFIITNTLEVRCKPPIAIPSEATKIHGITDADVKDSKPFIYYFSQITEFFLGSKVLVGHNLIYDKMVLYYELMRVGKTLQFPWAPGAICTVEVSQQFNGYRMNLMDLYTSLFGTGFADAHSASGGL